jgi:hypothetical protein
MCYWTATKAVYIGLLRGYIRKMKSLSPGRIYSFYRYLFMLSFYIGYLLYYYGYTRLTLSEEGIRG